MHIYDSSDCQIEINIANDELIKECRICFESGTNDNFLITPCLCDGTSKYIHTKCLRRWRMENYLKKPYHRCMECNYQYNIVPKYKMEMGSFDEPSFCKYSSFIIIQLLSMNTLFTALQYTDFDTTFEITTYGINNTAINKLKFILQNHTDYSFLYNLTMSSHISNLCSTFFFTLWLFCKVHRMSLYIDEMHQYIFCQFLILFNPTVMFFIYAMCGDFGIYILFVFFNSLIRFIFEPNFIKKHNYVINRMNIYHNEEKVINYKRYNLIDNDDEF